MGSTGLADMMIKNQGLPEHPSVDFFAATYRQILDQLGAQTQVALAVAIEVSISTYRYCSIFILALVFGCIRASKVF